MTIDAKTVPYPCLRRCRVIARVTTSQRSDADEAKLFIEDYAIPSLKQVPGFLGAYFLADREHQTGISITFWEDEAAARESAIASAERRHQATAMTGAVFEAVDIYEVIAQNLPVVDRKE
jgi:heme-degrading monooxygenase HmoA